MKCHSAAALGIQVLSESHFSSSLSFPVFPLSTPLLLSSIPRIYYPFFCSPDDQIILHKVDIQL